MYMMGLLGELNMMHDGKCSAQYLTRKRVQTLMPASAQPHSAAYRPLTSSRKMPHRN